MLFCFTRSRRGSCSAVPCPLATPVSEGVMEAPAPATVPALCCTAKPHASQRPWARPPAPERLSPEARKQIVAELAELEDVQARACEQAQLHDRAKAHQD